jgi:hypothetical protein
MDCHSKVTRSILLNLVEPRSSPDLTAWGIGVILINHSMSNSRVAHGSRDKEIYKLLAGSN